MSAIRSILVFSQSPAVIERFGELSHLGIDCSVAPLEQTECLLERIESNRPVLIVLDVRVQFGGEAAASLLELLERNASKNWRLLALSDGTISRSLASAVCRLADGYLDAAADCVDVEALSNSLSEHLNAEVCSQRVREGYRIEADDVKFETITPAMVPLLSQLEKISRHDVTLMLIGETGTGKTTLAKLMHRLSRRREGVFHTLACGAIPKDLIDSELFGHTRGAFTGAERSRVGRFEAASGGTLLLDEIDLLETPEQAKLLRVIETGEYEMVGSTETRHATARVIVASNVPLETLMQQKTFRADLYYRLNVLQFRLLPLREREPDIVPLALEMIDRFCAEHELQINTIHVEFLAALQAYDWPGNLRELKNQLSRALLFADNRELRLDHLTPEIVANFTQSDSEDLLEMSHQQSNPAETDNLPESLADQVAQNEREIVIETLKANNFKRKETAKALGISRVGLYKKMKRFELLDDQVAMKKSA